jgi:predicted amidohydrolase
MSGNGKGNDVFPVTRPRVALVQTRWRDGVEENLAQTLRLVDEAGRSGPLDLICLPEFFLGAPWYFPGRSHLKGIVDDTIPGAIIDRFAERAARYGCHLLCGTIVERDGDRYYNTSTLLGPDGKILGKARKIHRYSAEMLAVEQGEGQLLVDTPFGRVGVCVCSDFWIQEMPRMLALRGAEIIAVPGASIVQNLGITRPCIQANSAHNVCYTLYTSIVGSVTGRRGGREVTIALGGHTTVAAPERLLGGLDDEEAVLYAELDMADLRQQRMVDLTFKRSLYWCLWGRLPELYEGLQRPYVGAETDLKTLLSDYLR